MSMRELSLSRLLSRSAVALAATATLALAACGSDDDGADVRSSGEGADSGSASGSASGSDAASGSASAVAGECVTVDGTDGVADADTVVSATLDEWSIELDPASVTAAAVGFSAENVGEEAHELVIAAGTVDDITVVDGAPDEAALGDALIGEIEAFAPGETCEGTFALEAGAYVAFCAIVEEEEDGTIESHYENGMVTSFTVS